ncbi:MAG: hypothetical protein ACE5G1_12875 [bacterium]
MGQKVDDPWGSWGDDFTYVLMRKDALVQPFVEKVDALLLENTSEWFASRMDFIVQPLTDIHWNAELRGDIGAKGNRLYVYIFLSAAILVLLVASFNFMNLSTARYLDRIKDGGTQSSRRQSRTTDQPVLVRILSADRLGRFAGAGTF